MGKFIHKNTFFWNSLPSLLQQKCKSMPIFHPAELIEFKWFLSVVFCIILWKCTWFWWEYLSDDSTYQLLKLFIMQKMISFLLLLLWIFPSCYRHLGGGKIFILREELTYVLKKWFCYFHFHCHHHLALRLNQFPLFKVIYYFCHNKNWLESIFWFN